MDYLTNAVRRNSPQHVAKIRRTQRPTHRLMSVALSIHVLACIVAVFCTQNSTARPPQSHPMIQVAHRSPIPLMLERATTPVEHSQPSPLAAGPIANTQTLARGDFDLMF